jgi:hypothetical protein
VSRLVASAIMETLEHVFRTAHVVRFWHSVRTGTLYFPTFRSGYYAICILTFVAMCFLLAERF